MGNTTSSAPIPVAEVAQLAPEDRNDAAWLFELQARRERAISKQQFKLHRIRNPAAAPLVDSGSMYDALMQLVVHQIHLFLENGCIDHEHVCFSRAILGFLAAALFDVCWECDIVPEALQISALQDIVKGTPPEAIPMLSAVMPHLSQLHAFLAATEVVPTKHLALKVLFMRCLCGLGFIADDLAEPWLQELAEMLNGLLDPMLEVIGRSEQFQLYSVLLVAKVHKRFDTTVQRADSEWTNVGYQDLAASPSHPPAVPNDSFAFSPTRLAERAASAGDLTGLGDARHRAASVPALKAPATISAHLTLIEASGPQVLRPGRYFCRTHERGLYISSANATDTESHRVLLWVDVTSVSADSMNITLRTTTKQVWKFTADVALLEKCHVDFAAHWSAAEAAHRFPLRLSCPGSFLIDAEAYFLALLDAMRRARSEIFIASWMLSPYIYLSRAQPYDHNTRLDNLLLSKALEGVHVYVLLYKEQLVPALNSFETKQYLTRLHPNIQVQRHQPRMYYSHHQKTVIIDQEVAFVGGIDLCFGRYDNPEHKLVDTSTRILGCDYWNPAARAYTNNDPPLLDLFDRYKFPRQPWHDIQAVVRGEAARDAALNFIQRWNHHVSTVASTQRRLLAPKDADPDPEAFPGFGNGVFQCQLLRSLCPTTGNGVSEDSIYQTLLREIQNARHYIYIENQFFISSLGNNGLVYNTIAEALLQRITRAIKCQETFRVFLVIQPCGEGDPRTDVSVRVVMQYQKATVLALYNAVAELCPDPSEYLSICCLRGHDYLPSKQEDTAKRLVTGYIYIHAKLAIIDDIKVIVGSANINDRSLKGTRDSEVAMLMEDEEIIQGYMNGEPTNIGKTVFEFRCNLWAEHLGISLAPLNPVFDPICEETFRGIWQSSAELNTKAYTICFPFIPQNSIRTLEAFNKYAVHCSASENPLLRFVRGHLCQYPTHFLCGADLSPAVLEKENLIDRRCFL